MIFAVSCALDGPVVEPPTGDELGGAGRRTRLCEAQACRAPPTTETLRVLHILGACVCGSAGVTLVGLVPVPPAGWTPEAPKLYLPRASAASPGPPTRGAVITGIWNLYEVQLSDATTEYQVTVLVKLSVVAVSGIAAALHSRATTKAGLAIGGAVGLVAALAAVVLGVMLRG